jgi:hypothetical protein
MGQALGWQPAGSAAAAQTGPIVVTVTTDKPSYAPGEPVRLTLTARNVSTSPVPANGGAQEYDFVVRDASGADVWRWSAGKAFILIYRYGTLAPGETKTFSETWDQRRNDGQPVAPGTYRLFGTYTIDPPIDATPVSFTIGQGAPPATATASPSASPPSGSDFPPAWQSSPPRGPKAASDCPVSGQWLLLYWGSSPVRIAAAATPCRDADRFWANREGRWYGFAPASPEASDDWVVSFGEALFVHGR